jgi:hypothetical protein
MAKGFMVCECHLCYDSTPLREKIALYEEACKFCPASTVAGGQSGTVASL